MFQSGLIVKYSQPEKVERREELRHPIVREALTLTGISDKIEITSLADIPAGTGLGSSGSFTTALLHALHAHRRNIISVQELAEQACHIEIERLNEQTGERKELSSNEYAQVAAYSAMGALPAAAAASGNAFVQAYMQGIADYFKNVRTTP